MDDLSKFTTLARLSRDLAKQSTSPVECKALLTIAEWYDCKAEKIGNVPPKVDAIPGK